MSLKDRIGENIKEAMKSKDEVRLETVRSIKKVLLEKEIDARAKGQEGLTEAQEIEVLMQVAKQRRDAIEQYVKAGRQDMADQEAAELKIVEEYLPKQLSDEEVTAIIEEIITQQGASCAQDLGKVMGPAMQKLKGQADGKKIQEIVKAKLGN